MKDKNRIGKVEKETMHPGAPIDSFSEAWIRFRVIIQQVLKLFLTNGLLKSKSAK